MKPEHYKAVSCCSNCKHSELKDGRSENIRKWWCNFYDFKIDDALPYEDDASQWSVCNDQEGA